jgi:hypothetical protein
VLGFVTACLLVAVALEAAAFVLFYAATGRRFSYEGIAREQAAEIQAWAPPVASPPSPAPVTVAPAPPGPVVEGRPETTPRDMTPHPFMGFVYDPESPRTRAKQGKGALPLTEQGFFSLPDPVGEGDELSVAVFGGSMAAYFSVDGSAAMARVFAEDAALRGRRLRVHSFALGGFKQPQMLGALAYLLALGHRFDVVVELDGFNDVALSFVTYKDRGVFPAYPRDWDWLVRPVPDVDQLRRIGRVDHLQEWRSAVARRFAARPWSYSVTAGLVWKSLDRLFGGELARARAALEKTAAARNGYRERGPVRHYASDRELLNDIARTWALSSLQMHRLCAAEGMRYHHFLQPNQYVPGSKPMGAAEKAVAYREDNEYRLPVAEGYPLLQAEGLHLASLGVDFHDLTRLYAGVTEPLYIDDCCHVSRRANAMMGEVVGKVIAAGWQRQGPIGSPGDPARRSGAPAPRP